MDNRSNPFDPHLGFASFFDKDLRSVAYQLSKNLIDGHICLDIDNYNQELASKGEDIEEYYKKYFEVIDLNKLKQNDLVAQSEKDEFPNKPFVLNKNKIYLQRYWVYESKIIEAVQGLIQASKENYESRYNILSQQINFISSLFKENIQKDIDWQLCAALTSVLNNFSIITGGPGTGKTYTVTKLLTILFRSNIDASVVMAAPTGKAAARLKDSLDQGIEKLDPEGHIKERLLNIESRTIHSLLGYKKGTHRFKYDRNYKLKYDVIIADEASMIDVALMSKLLEAVDKSSRIIFLGDKDQLASVEAGSVFGDLCRAGLNNGQAIEDIAPQVCDLYKQITGKNHLAQYGKDTNLLSGIITVLKGSYRFDEHRGIGLFSKQVIAGNEQVVDKDEFYALESEVVITEDDDFAEQFFAEFKRYLNNSKLEDVHDEFDRFRILSATKNWEYGVYERNKRLETYLGLNVQNELFYHNQPLMITKNDKQLEIYNGDTGIVRKNEQGKYVLHLKGRKGIPVALLSDFETAFAMTIHKSQGSDYDTVLIYIPEHSQRLLSRELIYTAVTRAKKKAVIFAKNEVLKKAVAQRVKRASGIEERLKAEK